MKNRILIALIGCLTFTGYNTDAQIVKSYGVKIAYTSANQEYTYPPWSDVGVDAERRSGINAAVFVEWLNAPIISVVTQIEYAQRGRSYERWTGATDSHGPTNLITMQDRVEYLSFPLTAKFTVPGDLVSPFVTMGPRFDVLLGYDAESIHFLYDMMKKTAIGGTASVGCEISNVLPITLSFELRYNLDLTDAVSTNALKIRNDSFDVWFGIGF